MLFALRKDDGLVGVGKDAVVEVPLHGAGEDTMRSRSRPFWMSEGS